MAEGGRLACCDMSPLKMGDSCLYCRAGIRVPLIWVLPFPYKQNTAMLLLQSFGVDFSPCFYYLDAGAGSLYEELWEKIS